MTADLDALYRVLAGADFSPCAGCDACCEGAWATPEEAARLAAVAPGAVLEDRGVHFLGDGRRCPLLGQGACARYADRPLDCRLFPLDIVRHDGALWWCVFRSCVRPDDLAARLVPLIDALEAALTPAVMAHFERQIAVTRDRYPAYANGAYRPVRELRRAG